MSDRARLETTCPNNHNITLTFTRKDFEAALESDSLVFHCNTCDTNWPPSKHEIAEIRKQFAQD